MTKLLLRLFVSGHQTPERPEVRSRCGKLAGLVGIVCNLLLFALKLLAGLLAGSVAVMADAFNNLADAASSLITLVGFRLAERPADDEHPYGHARVEYITGLAVAAVILIIGVELAKSSVSKILHPQAVAITPLTVVILMVSMGVKLWMALFCRSVGKYIRSEALLATATDNRNDVLSTAAVLLGCLGTMLLSVPLDGYIGLLVALFILWSGINVARETISPLLGRQADPALVERISKLICSHDHVLGFHDLMVHDYGPGQCFASVHAEMPASMDALTCHDILDDIERACLEQLRVHLVVHYDPVVTDDAELGKLRSLVEQEVRAIDSALSIHDFRMVRSAQHTNLIFDLVLPFSMGGQKAAIKKRIDERIQREDRQYYTVITFDEASLSQCSRQEQESQETAG